MKRAMLAMELDVLRDPAEKPVLLATVQGRFAAAPVFLRFSRRVLRVTVPELLLKSRARLAAEPELKSAASA